jgi:DNA-binding MarR family transcriptional regulator
VERVTAAHGPSAGSALVFFRNFFPEGLFLPKFMTYQSIDTEYIILENIYDSSEQTSPLRQRDLAQIAGTSLGMTNSILKRLAQKGWITVKKMNSRNIRYAVTLDGINEILHRSYRYFKRTIRNAVYYKDMLDDMIHRAKRKNVNAVILAGTSDLDFIVEHTCQRWGLSFLKVIDTETAREAWEARLDDTFMIYAENIPENIRETPASNVFYLSRLLMRRAAGVRA